MMKRSLSVALQDGEREAITVHEKKEKSSIRRNENKV